MANGQVKLLATHASINLILSLLIVGVQFYAGNFLEDPWHTVRTILETPGMFILMLIQGRSKTLHATGEKTYLLTSLAFYVVTLAMVQFALVKWRNRNDRA